MREMMSNPTDTNQASEELPLPEQIDRSFPIQWVRGNKKYGLSTSALKSRLRCYFTHIPLTRNYVYKWHDLSCGALIICRIDNIISGKKMMHEMRERGFEL